MILDAIINILFNDAMTLMGAFQLDEIAWNFDPSGLEPFLRIVRSILYFLPVQTFAQILGIVVAFGIFRAGIRLVLTIWDLLPLL